MNSINVQLGVVVFCIIVALMAPVIAWFEVWLWERSWRRHPNERKFSDWVKKEGK